MERGVNYSLPTVVSVNPGNVDESTVVPVIVIDLDVPIAELDAAGEILDDFFFVITGQGGRT